MSICMDCGDIEIFYVPSCGDPAVGSSVVLLFGGDQALAELNAEITAMEAAFDALQTATPDANTAGDPHDALANMLKDYIDPAGALTSKHVVQVFNVRSRKYNYIRSDKMRNHLRSYQVRPQLLEPRQVGSNTDPKQLDKPSLIAALSGVKEQLASDLASGVQAEGTLIQGNVSGSLSKIWDGSFARWVDGINNSLLVSKSGDNYDLSAGAQLMRGYAGFKVNLGHNPSENSYGLSLGGNARANLAEAKAELTGYLPDRDGWHALLDLGGDGSSNGQTGNSQTQLDFGYFRFKAQISADAMVGASIMGNVGIEYKPEADGKVMGRGSDANGKGGVAAGAFAGVEAAAEVKGGLEWDNPEKRQSSGRHGWATVFEVGVTIAANAGIGASAEFNIEYYEPTGKIYVRGGAQLVIGVGAKGGITAALGLNTIADFIMYIFHQLVANDFAKLNFIAPKAFKAIQDLALFVLLAPARLTMDIGRAVIVAARAVTEMFKDAQEAEDFARRIQARPDILTFGPPETKGMVLYRLSETFVNSREEYQEGAILVVMDTIQSRREWEQVIERVSQDGSKTGKAAGMARLNYVLDFGSQRKFTEKVLEIESQREIAPDTPTRYYA
ncbi:hypothetical protein [uncultured Litoreibacter sp.]|uniref:hypothetical protein n=1 Tax=uncultured Litoreibacter sp. TaxID=1392394 RepID=UPI002633E867|nr:hypothetical protein [uncultured Litoreibacter sp.]